MYLRMSFFNIVIIISLAHIFKVYILKKNINSTLCNFVVYQLLRKFLVYNISKKSIYCTKNFEICCYIFFSYKFVKCFNSFFFIIFLYY